MNRPDGYYGATAERYDSERSIKEKWKAEQAAVERFLRDGPVLDVPFGTGRFVPLYRAKELNYTGIDISPDMLEQARQKFGEVNARQGSAFDLPFQDGEFKTAICVRFLEWIPVDRAETLLRRLAKLAHTLIVTITHGQEGRPEAFTYDYGKWLKAIDGLLIEDRQVTAHVRDMISEIFKLRPACWQDVLDQFSHDHPGREAVNVQRLADKFGVFFGLYPMEVSEGTIDIRAEYWSGEKVAGVVQSLADHNFVTDEAPRETRRPLTVIERNGYRLMIDGRKRANRLMHETGPHPVLVLRPKCLTR